MKISQLNQRVVFQDYEETYDDLGNAIHTWKDAHEVWANITLKKMAKKKAEQVVYQGNVCEVIIRYQRDIYPRMRIKYGSQILLIESIQNLHHNNKYFIITAIQKVY